MSARLARCMHSMRTAFGRMQEDLDPTLIGVLLLLSWHVLHRHPFQLNMTAEAMRRLSFCDGPAPPAMGYH
jgi:hypothetical protein